MFQLIAEDCYLKIAYKKKTAVYNPSTLVKGPG